MFSARNPKVYYPNRKQFCRFIFFFTFFLLFSLLPGSAFAITVSAESAETIGEGSIDAARDAALSEALRTAVVNAAKTIRPDIDDKYFMTLKQEDYLSYIKAFRILSETSAGKEYRIAIEADVDSQKLKNVIKDFMDLKSKSFLKPSISVVVLLNPESDSVIRSISLQDIKREVSVIFIGSGYKVQEQPGDVILEAYTSVKTTESRFGGSEKYAFGNVYIRAKNKNGELIAEASDDSSLSGNDLGDISQKAVKQAALSAASNLKSKFDEIWGDRDGTIRITFRGFRTYAQYENMDGILSDTVVEVDSITKRVFENGKITFFLFSSATPEKLAQTLGSLPLQDFSLRLDKVSFDEIEFSVVDKP